MPSFAGGNGNFTPSTTNDNYTLDAQTTVGGPIRVTMVGWGGSNTSSNGYRTRWTRATTLGSGTLTQITAAGNNPSFTTSASALVSAYGTAQPVLAADPGANLYATDWNNQGGSGILVLPIAQAWWLVANGGVSKQQLSCRNTKGTDANLSSYQIMWEED